MQNKTLINQTFLKGSGTGKDSSFVSLPISESNNKYIFALDNSGVGVVHKPLLFGYISDFKINACKAEKFEFPFYATAQKL